MAVITTKTKKIAKNSVGSPSQYKQSSRKGKKAWRKNVDIQEIEEGLEEIRTEERVTGSSLWSKTNEELFQVDVKGDDNIRKHSPRFDKTQLSYYKNVLQRSAVPAVVSRVSASSSSKKRHIRLTQEEKKRLLRIAQRKRQGPFNSVEDTAKLGQGSALLEPSHAVKQSGEYDVWSTSNQQQDDSAHADIEEEKQDFLIPLVEKLPVKPPKVPNVRNEIALPAVVPPHAGASYNPPATAHQELLKLVHEKTEREDKEVERYKGVKKKMEEARKIGWVEMKPGVPVGMKVDDGDNDMEDGDEDKSKEDLPLPKKPSARKTKQQRKKAEKLKIEKRALAERRRAKRFLSSFDSSILKSAQKSINNNLTSRERLRIGHQILLQKKLARSGLAGTRLGKHVVPEMDVEVQLGEDLSESLRGLKVEGNLFRDRFKSLQQRALLEPRVPVLPTRHRATTKEVEKFAWKSFE